MGGDLHGHRCRGDLRWLERADAPAYPSLAVTEELTAQAIRIGALALSDDVSRDPGYQASQEDSER